MSSQHKPMFTKEDLSKIYRAAALYDRYLCNKSVFLLYRDLSQHLNYEKIEFRPSNFSHLIGCIPNYKSSVSASFFYKKALKEELVYRKDFSFSHGDTKGRFYFDLKMDTVGHLFRLPTIPLQIGSYNDDAFVNLTADKIVGHTPACLAIEFGEDSYYPKSILNRDIRECVYPDTLFPIIATACIDNGVDPQSQRLEFTYISKALFPKYTRSVEDLAVSISKANKVSYTMFNSSFISICNTTHSLADDLKAAQVAANRQAQQPVSHQQSHNQKL